MSFWLHKLCTVSYGTFSLSIHGVAEPIRKREWVIWNMLVIWNRACNFCCGYVTQLTILATAKVPLHGDNTDEK